jgi:hypothetical protein
MSSENGDIIGLNRKSPRFSTLLVTSYDIHQQAVRQKAAYFNFVMNVEHNIVK